MRVPEAPATTECPRTAPFGTPHTLANRTPSPFTAHQRAHRAGPFGWRAPGTCQAVRCAPQGDERHKWPARSRYFEDFEKISKGAGTPGIARGWPRQTERPVCSASVGGGGPHFTPQQVLAHVFERRVLHRRDAARTACWRRAGIGHKAFKSQDIRLAIAHRRAA